MYTLKRHIEKCKIKKLEDEKKENIFNNLIEKEKINDLFKMYEQIKKENEEKNKLINEQSNKKRIILLLNYLESNNYTLDNSLFCFAKMYDIIQSQCEDLHINNNINV